MFNHMACFYELACGGGHKWPAIFLRVCLALIWIVCLKMRLSVSQSDNQSWSQTVCLQIRQSVPCWLLSRTSGSTVVSKECCASKRACGCSKSGVLTFAVVYGDFCVHFMVVFWVLQYSCQSKTKLVLYGVCVQSVSTSNRHWVSQDLS